MSKKKRIRMRRKKYKKIDKAIEIEQILLENRQLFLFDCIDEKSTTDLIKKMIALDKINTKSIALYINSGGGYVSDGFAIVDTMRSIESNIITIITGQACSMAGFISIAGDKRYITKNSRWMGHDVFGGGADYGEKVIDSAKQMVELRKQMNEFYEEYTSMTKKDIQKATHGELWLDPYECLKKGIVDGIIK